MLDISIRWVWGRTQKMSCEREAVGFRKLCAFDNELRRTEKKPNVGKINLRNQTVTSSYPSSYTSEYYQGSYFLGIIMRNGGSDWSKKFNICITYLMNNPTMHHYRYHE